MEYIGYVIERGYGVGKTGGGLLIYVKDDLVGIHWHRRVFALLLYVPNKEEFSFTWVQFKFIG